jgi:predicted ribosome quality control (RQC) complex YloA/Tae2 family protein
MSVAFDAVLVAALARELEERLGNARLRALRLDRAGRSIALLFREGTLRVGLHPGVGTVTWHDPTEPGPEDRPMRGSLTKAEALPDDRVLRLSFRKARGAPASVDILIEWITNRWNALVTEGTESVVRHVLVELEGERAARTGHPWSPPPPSQREGTDGEIPLVRWRELLLAADPKQRRQALIETFAWTSPINAAALLGSAANDDGRTAEKALEAGHEHWQKLAAVALGRLEMAPVVLNPRTGLQPYPFPLRGTDEEEVTTLLDGFARAAGEAGTNPSVVPTRMLETLNQRVVRAWARVESLQRELDQAPDPAEVRRIGDLILARLRDVPRGQERVSLTDFEGASVEVELDPRLPPHENASLWYERAGRAERARERLPRLISQGKAEAHRWEALLERARAGDLTAEAILAELPSSVKKATRGTASSLPYRTYRSSGGLEIRVGRGGRHNDDLTFHHAAPDDVWLHARHAAGAHVVLRWQGEGNPPARDLVEAATLAAFHSKARSSGAVPVNWTRRKYVRKPRKSPPGEVLVERAKTVFVEPDAAVEGRLRQE